MPVEDQDRWDKLNAALAELTTSEAVTAERVKNLHDRFNSHDEEHKRLAARVWAAFLTACAGLLGAALSCFRH